MNLLGLDTSSDTFILGLDVAGELLDGSAAVGREHSRKILPAIESLLSDAGLALEDLDGIVLGRGPGSFTGLRIGVGVAQGLAYGLGLPVAPVSSLACRAQALAADEGALVAVALRARLTEVYYGAYRIAGGLAQLQQAECVTEASQAPKASPGAWLGLGDGWEFREQLEAALGVKMTQVQLDSPLTGKALLALGRPVLAAGQGVEALAVQPEYLREEVAAKPRACLATS